MWRVGTLSAFLSVALGAFAAHALKDRLDAYHLGVFQTGVHYQFFHALAICLVSLMPNPSRSAFYAFAIGTFFFSGSLYALALTGVKVFGAITPLGGVSFLVGWGILVGSARTGPKLPS